MTLLVSLATLRIVARRPNISDDLETVDGAFANWVLTESSGLVCDTAGHPEWETTGTPDRRAVRIATALAVRTYLNFEQVVQSSVGPLSERVREEAAMALELTEAEIDTLEAIPGGTSGGSGFWVQPLATAYDTDDTVYLLDGEHPETSDTIPYFDPDDVGYPDES